MSFGEIADEPFQIFCYGRYRKPIDPELTQYQKQVLSLVRKEGLMQAAQKMGVTRQNIEAHLSLIRSKGVQI